MPLSIQVKLLRVLQDGSFSRVGSNETSPPTCGSSPPRTRNSGGGSAAGRFREDLYYRLNVVEIRIPPLARAPEDIPLLAEFFLQRITRKNGMARIRLSAEGQHPASHTWPGNVRELENTIARACALASSNILLPADIPLASAPGKIAGAGSAAVDQLINLAPAGGGSARLDHPRSGRPGGGSRRRRPQKRLVACSICPWPSSANTSNSETRHVPGHRSSTHCRRTDPPARSHPASPEFRQRMRRIASLMVPQVTAGLPTHVVAMQHTAGNHLGSRLSRGIILVPVLRAGLVFLDGFLDLIPQASVAHIGLARNERTLLPEPIT
jgi:hypothetical protein